MHTIHIRCAAAVLCLAGMAPAAADSIFRLLASNGDTLTSGDTLSSISFEASINRAGNVAFGATLTASSGTGSGVVLLGDSLPARRITFAPSPSRTYASVQLNDLGQTIVRDRVAGSPPAFFARKWSADGTFSVLADTNVAPLSGIVLTSLANDGGAAFVGLTNDGAVTGLYVNPNGVRADNRLVYNFVGAGARPAVADGSQVVMRVGNAGAHSLRYSAPDPSTGQFSIRTLTEATVTRVGATPGITDDGVLSAFYAEDAQGPGIFVSDHRHSGPAVRVISVGQEVNSTVPGRTLASLSPDSKIAVERVDSRIGQQYRLLFSATDDQGVSSLVAARVSAVSNRVYEASVLAAAGRQTRLTGGGTTISPTILATSDPLNSVGGAAFVMSSGSQQQLVRGDLPGLTKYKQYQDNHVLNNWADTPLNSSLPASDQRLFRARGCFVTTVAAVAAHYGFEANPLELRDLALDQNVMVGNNFSLAGVMAQTGLRLHGNNALKSTNSTATVQDLVSALRGGNAVLLRVPTQAFLQTGDDGAMHAIMAFGIDPTLNPSDTFLPSHIFVSDAGYGAPYAAMYGSAYTPGEQLVNVTLQDVFDRMNNQSSGFTFDPHQWFDQRQFVRDSDAQVLSISNGLLAPGNMSFFELVDSSTLPQLPSVNVNSPVDLALVDPLTGRRYVSSNSLLGVDDVLLEKAFGEIGGDEETGEVTVPEAFPHYSLILPTELLGRSLNVDIYGLADGDFSIKLFTGSDLFVSSGALSGTITGGQIISGAFTVTAVPEPAVVLLMTAGLLVVFRTASRQRSVVRH